MKIISKLIVSSGTAIILSLVAVSALFFVSERTRTAMRIQETASSIHNAVSDLNNITYEYLLYHEERMRSQWFMKHRAILSSLPQAIQSAGRIGNSEYLEAILATHKDLGKLFGEVIDHHAGGASDRHAPIGAGRVYDGSIEARLIGRMLIASQEMITNAARFNAVTLARMKSAERQQVRIIAVIMFLFTLGMIIIFFLLGRSILRPLNTLLEGTRMIGAGNLNYTVAVASRDELGLLAGSFNEMARNIRETTASRDELDREIEERKKAEAKAIESKEEWEKTFNAMSDVVTIQDRDMRIIMANKTAHETFRVEPGELTGKFCYECFGSTNLPCALCPELLTREDKKNHSAEITHQKIGKIFTVTSSPILDEQGEITRIVHSARDITAQKMAERKQASLEERLQQAQKMEAIGTLAGGIAHDFNNILSVILGYTGMVKDDLPPGSRLIDDLEKVLEAGNRAKELVKQILAFSRQAKIERIPIQLQSLIKEAMKMLRSSIPTTIEIRDNIDSGCGVVLADPTQVHQILMNLCTNANHAMEETGGALTVQLQNNFIDEGKQQAGLNIQPGQYVELTVADTGSGIGPDLIDKIFDPYFTTKEMGKGTGMGLAIVHGIITSYGGAITVQSELGRGTTFQVYFPVVAKEELAAAKTVEKIPLGNERILFVDDEDLLAEMGKDMLERLGYHVTVRHSSLEALTTFQSNPQAFDVMITDQTMPDMTGSDLARRILQIRPGMPVILCTGYSNLIDEHSAKVLGIQEFALKPLTKEVISKLIRKVLKKPTDDGRGA